MTTILDAMKQALTVLKQGGAANNWNDTASALTALSLAIEQMEKAEPVGMVKRNESDQAYITWYGDQSTALLDLVGNKLFTHPAPAAPSYDATKWQLVLKDAERYRYLRHASRRECLDKNGPKAGCWIDCEDEYHTLILLTEEDADEAIDKAMLSAAPKIEEDV